MVLLCDLRPILRPIIETIQWNDYFETGLQVVDTQHHHLVELTNRLGESIIDSRMAFEDIQKIVSELANYAIYHFQTEEQLMGKLRLDVRHIRRHKNEHLDFMAYVSTLIDVLLPNNHAEIEELLAYLTRWLVYHILGSDKELAEQVLAVEHGMSPEVAFNSKPQAHDGITEILLNALNGLFQQLSTRNIQLIKLNQELEQKVEERTLALQEANRRLEELALTDMLTTLPNRRHAMSQLAVFWKERIDSNPPLSCLMIDADGFKQINDRYGHDAGDVVLKELAGAIRNGIRTDDFAARIGGDEFFVLCPATDFKGAMIVAESLCNTVAKMKVTAGQGTWLGSVSIGVATASDDDITTAETLVKAADESVYAAKRAGKGCVRSVQDL